MVSLKKQTLSEFFCSLLVSFLGLGCIVPLNLGYLNYFQFSLAFGLVIAFVVIVFSPISGAQFNPGVTLAMILIKRQDRKTFIPFFFAQLLGWFLGAGLVYGVLYNAIKDMDPTVAVNLLYCNYNKGGLQAAIPLEFILTGFMVIIILASNDKRIINKPTKALFPILLALYITFAIALAGPFSGTCLNLTRDLGPRLFALIWGAAHGYDVSACFNVDCQFLVYLFVPAAGAVAGAFLYDFNISRLLPKTKVDNEKNIDDKDNN